MQQAEEKCARCSTAPCHCLRGSKRPRRGGELSMGRPFPSSKSAIEFRRTSNTVTRLFRNALEGGELDTERTVRTLSAWGLRRTTCGIDYSYGALDNIQSFLGNEMKGLIEDDRSRPASEALDYENENMGKAWSQLDDGRSCMSCMVYNRGYWKILCNRQFERKFASGAEMEQLVEEERAFPSFFYGSTIMEEDHDEFVQLLVDTLFRGDGKYPFEQSAVLKCVDRHCASFLAMVRFRLVCLGSGCNMGLQVSILPLPKSRWVLPSSDMAAPGLMHIKNGPGKASSSSSSSSSWQPPAVDS